MVQKMIEIIEVSPVGIPEEQHIAFDIIVHPFVQIITIRKVFAGRNIFILFLPYRLGLHEESR